MPRLRLRAWLRLLGSTVCGLLPGSEGWSSGGGLKAGVPLGGGAWCSTLTLASTSAGAVPGFSWGRLRLVFGGVGTEDEVEGRAGSSWPCLGESVAGRCVSGFSHFVPTARVVGYAWRLPTFCPYGALAVVGLPGRGLGASVAGRLVSECRSLGLPGGGRKAAVPLGDTAWSFSVRRSFSANTGPYGESETSTSTLALAGSAGAVAWGRAVPVAGSPGGGRKAAVALGDAGWCLTVRRSFSANIHPYGRVMGSRKPQPAGRRCSRIESWEIRGLQESPFPRFNFG